MIIDMDDFGSNHIISDQCQSHDCRKQLDALHYANPNLKVTLFTIPGEMTAELCQWCKANSSWIELAVHGWYHSSNYECNDMTYDEFEDHYQFFKPMLDEYFVKGFRAPGWQISDGVLQWLDEHDWWIGDQSYNDHRRPVGLAAYINNGGIFLVNGEDADGHHYHVWNTCGNGIEECYDDIERLIHGVDNFQFISEVVS